MSFILENMVLTPLIAVLAICALVSPRPSMSAIFLLFESIIINIVLYIKSENNSELIATSILLSFFIMIIVGNNIFFEISYKNPTLRPPKTSLIIGALFIFLFWMNYGNFSLPHLFEAMEDAHSFTKDGLTMIISGFALFVSLVSALTILDIKTAKSGS